jgi:hypothetical protein
MMRTTSSECSPIRESTSARSDHGGLLLRVGSRQLPAGGKVEHARPQLTRGPPGGSGRGSFGPCSRGRETGMAVRPFIVAPEDYAPALDIVGEHVTVLASGEATEGYEIFLQRGPEGNGPPPHSHPWDESFYVVKGRSTSASAPNRRPHRRELLCIFPPAQCTGSASAEAAARWSRSRRALVPPGCSPTWPRKSHR